MPIIVPRKVIPIEEAKPLPVEPPPPALTQADVESMLAAQAAAFEKQIKAVTSAFAAALAAASSKPKDKPVVGWDFDVKYDNHNTIQSISATARTKKE